MENGDIDIRKIMGVLRRQARLIIVTIVLIVATAATVAFMLRPSYTATTLVMVDNAQNLLEGSQQVVVPDNAWVESEVEIIRSNSILLRAVEQLDLVSDPEFGVSIGLTDRLFSLLRVRDVTLPTGATALQQSMDRLRRAVSVGRRGATYLIAISVNSASPQRAAQVSNAVAGIYVDDQLSSKIANVVASRDILQRQVEQARAAIAQSETAFDSFVNENIQRISEETGTDELRSIQGQIQALQQARQQGNTLADTVQRQVQAEDWDSLVATVQSQALTELDRQRDELVAALDTAANTGGTQSEIDLRAELANVENTLRSEAQQQITSIRDQVTQSQTAEDNLRQQLRNQVFSSDLSADVLAQLYGLQQSGEIARTQYQTLLTRVQDLDAQANLQIADSRIVSPALAPQSPSFPNRFVIIGAALILSLVIGVLLAFLYENFIGGFVTEEQMASVAKVRVASAIPKARESDKAVSDLIVTAPLSPFSESIRRVRAVADHSMGLMQNAGVEGVEGKVIMVTSTAPYEGKSTASLALARSCASSKRRVLLIDCDLRKPSMHKLINVEPTRGLRDFLALDGDASTINNFVIGDPLTPLTLVLATRNSSQPTDQLLASPMFRNMIDSARRMFDLVILDTPPVGPVVDGLYLAPYADTILFLTRWAVTPQSDVKTAIASLRQAKREETEIIGILSQQDAPRSSYMKKYGGYYRDETQPA